MNNIVEHMEKVTIQNCEKHEGEEYKYYCKTCDTPTCKDCTLQEHSKHEYCPIEDVAKSSRKRLVNILVNLREQKANLKDDICNFETLENSFKERNKEVHEEINEHFDALVKSVESQRAKLLSKANQITESKLQKTGVKIEEFRLNEACLESHIHDITTRFDQLKDVEVLSAEKRVSQDLESMQFENEYEQRSVDDMKFHILSSVEDFEKSLNENHFVAIDDVCAKNCTSVLEQTELRNGEQVVLTVKCKDKEDNDIKHGGQEVKAKFSGDATVREVGNINYNDGTHDINFVPTLPGKLIVRVYINGEKARKCKLQTTVR